MNYTLSVLTDHLDYVFCTPCCFGVMQPETRPEADEGCGGAAAVEYELIR